MKLSDLRNYSVAVFDCDGVVLNSNTIKSEAFRSTVSDYSPSLADKFVAYHQAHGGVSRYIKFRYFFEEIACLAQDDVNDAMQEALQRYANIVKQELLVCDLIPGVERVLNYLNEQGVKAFVCSGGDQAELREVFGERGLSSYFEEIYGSPKTKVENLELLDGKNDLSSGLFFGDAKSDFEAAEKYRMDFTYITGVSEWKGGIEFCSRKGKDIIQNFSEFD